MKKQILVTTLLLGILLGGCSVGRDGLSSSDESEISQSSNVDEFSETERLSEKELLLEIVNSKYLPVFGSLINCDDWNNAEEIPVYMYYDWYRNHINSVTTPEERIEKYTLDSDKYSIGWAYPAEEFENYITQYFNVEIEYLRNTDDVYQADKDVYWIPAGGVNITVRTKVESIEDINMENEYLLIRVACSLFGDFSDTYYKYLTIDISEDQIKFISCVAA